MIKSSNEHMDIANKIKDSLVRPMEMYVNLFEGQFKSQTEEIKKLESARSKSSFFFFPSFFFEFRKKKFFLS